MSELGVNNNHANSSFNSITQSSIILSNFELQRPQSKRLEKVYDKLAHHFITFREKKISLLERLDNAINIKAKAKEQIANIQKIQTKKMQAKRLQRERVLIQQLKNRQIAQQKLNDCIEDFKLQHKASNIEVEYGKADRLLQLIQSNLKLQVQLSQLTQRQAMQKQNQQEIIKEIYEMISQKGGLQAENLDFQKSKQPQPQFYNMKPNQLQNYQENLDEDGQILLKQAIFYSQFQDLTTNDILCMKSQEQMQRQLLFEEIQKMKTEMARMQLQNILMQQTLSNSNA